MEFLKDKKILVMGLGLLGGGVATTKWLLKNGAQVTVTDSKTEVELASSLEKFTEEERKNLSLSLGGHKESDFTENDVIVINPAVPKESQFIALARNAGKLVENDASLFFRFFVGGSIGVTGTRGKTTVTSWIASVLSEKYGDVRPSGNTPDNAFLKEFDRITGTSIPVVAELSSWQLETLPSSECAPHIAVITNLFPDHLNRYKEGIEGYALAKANIFKYQNENDFLILNDVNPWTSFFVAQKPQSKIYYFSKNVLDEGKDGMFVRGGKIYFRNDNAEQEVFSAEEFTARMGEHNLENLLATLLAINLFDSSFEVTEKIIEVLPVIPLRQEIIVNQNGLVVVNDSAGTSPDAVVALLRRFKKDKVLITGGTDKDLEFTDLAREITETLKPHELILLDGSATKKLLAELEALNFFKNEKPQIFQTLEECVRHAFAILPEKRGTILFSPGAASFEKFKNEFDRGEQFLVLTKTYI